MKMLLGKRAENICWGLLGLAIGASSAYFWLIEEIPRCEFPHSSARHYRYSSFGGLESLTMNRSTRYGRYCYVWPIVYRPPIRSVPPMPY